MRTPSGPRPFTLWVLREDEDAADALLLVEFDNGNKLPFFLARTRDDVRALLASHGRPHHIVANSWAAVRFARQAEPALFHVSADILTPDALNSTLLMHLFAMVRRAPS